MTAGCLSTPATVLPKPVTSCLAGKVKVWCRFSLGSHLRHNSRKDAIKSRQYQLRQRLLVTSYAEYDRGATQYRSRFDSTTSSGVTGTVQSASFNQQLLLLLSIPAVALGLPLVLSHPIICIVIPFIVYKTPALYSIVEPVLTTFLQFFLSGLRPSGSPRSGGFPWQQTRQGSWSPSPPIDVEYRYLPADPASDQYNQTQASATTQSPSQAQSPSATGSVESYTAYAQPSTSYGNTQPDTPSRQQSAASDTSGRQQVAFDTSSRQQVAFDTPSRQRVAFDTSNRQQVKFDRQPTVSMPDYARSRNKVSINPTNRQSMQNGRIVRQAAPGQVGVNVGPDAPITIEPNSNLVRALLGVFPFLRHWGGFL